MSENMVSITLQNNEDARPVIEAIEQDNPEVTVQHFPAMVKIDATGRLEIRKETVDELLGRDWDPQEMHLHIITISGNVDEDDDYFALERSN